MPNRNRSELRRVSDRALVLLTREAVGMCGVITALLSFNLSISALVNEDSTLLKAIGSTGATGVTLSLLIFCSALQLANSTSIWFGAFSGRRRLVSAITISAHFTCGVVWAYVVASAQLTPLKGVGGLNGFVVVCISASIFCAILDAKIRNEESRPL